MFNIFLKINDRLKFIYHKFLNLGTSEEITVIIIFIPFNTTKHNTWTRNSKKLIRNSIKQFIETWYLHFLSWMCGPKCLRIKCQMGFLHSSAGKESAHNAGDLGSIPVGKIPWRMEGLPTPVFWPGEFHGLYSPWGHKELDTTK